MPRLVTIAPGVRAQLSTTRTHLRGVISYERRGFRVALAVEVPVMATKRIVREAARTHLRPGSVSGGWMRLAGDPLPDADDDDVLDDDELLLYSAALGAASDRARRKKRRETNREQRQDKRQDNRRERAQAFAGRVKLLSRQLAEARVIDKLRAGFNRVAKSKVTAAILQAAATAAGGAAGGPAGAMMAQSMVPALLPGPPNVPAPAQTFVHVAGVGEVFVGAPAYGAADIGWGVYKRAIRDGL